MLSNNTSPSAYNVTLSICEQEAAEGNNYSLWYVGVIISICSSVASNLGVNIQKFSMTKEMLREKSQQRGYFCQPAWSAGLVLVIGGAIGDFTALGFAAQSLCVPVGALTMVANVAFAHFWLGEALSRRDVIATSLVTVGVILTAAFGDKSTQCYTLADLQALYLEPGFLGYISFSVPFMLTLFLMAQRADKIVATKGVNSVEYRSWEKIHPALYPVLSGFVGAQSVLFAKSVAELVKLTLRGYWMLDWFLILVFGLMVVTVFTQIHFLATGLKHFDAIFVVPVFQSAFIVGAILVGATYFQEFSQFSLLQAIFFPAGILIVVLGVMLLAQRKMTAQASVSSERSLDSKDEKQRLFVRRQHVQSDLTPSVVTAFRELKHRLGGRHVTNSRRPGWQRGQTLPNIQSGDSVDPNTQTWPPHAGSGQHIVEQDLAMETVIEVDEDGRVITSQDQPAPQRGASTSNGNSPPSPLSTPTRSTSLDSDTLPPLHQLSPRSRAKARLDRADTWDPMTEFQMTEIEKKHSSAGTSDRA